MSTEILVDTVSTTDSCQMTATGSTLKITTATQPVNQVDQTCQIITGETYTTIPPRRTFNEQKPFIFSIIGFAVFYIALLIIGRIIKMRTVHHP